MGEQQVTFEVECEIYRTQWTNIRQYWDQTFSAVKYLSTLVMLAVVPLKFMRISTDSAIKLGVDPNVELYIKWFVAIIILIMGVVTILNQYNNHARSKEARNVVVSIERKWGLYDDKDKFIFQEPRTSYAYSKFAGGEKRLTHAKVQFAYIIAITLAGLIFVIFA